MKARTITGTIEVGKLLGADFLAKTKQFSHEGEMASILVERIKAKEGIMLPTVASFADLSPEYAKQMITLYDATFGLFDEVNVIPKWLKIAQGAVLDSFCYGYDLVKCCSNIYTMRVDLFGDELEDKDLKKIIEANVNGQVKALKFSYEYKNCENKVIDYKLGAHRTILDEENCVLVPLITGTTVLGVLKKFMSSGIIVKIAQQLANTVKIRCVTEKQEVLQHYCDDPYAVVGLKSQYYPLDGFFYAPVIGAPSTTAMMTNVNIFNISELKRLQNAKQLSEYGVQKPTDPIKRDIEEYLICKTLLDMAEDENSDDFENSMRALPKLEVFGEWGRDITERDIKRYLHVMKNVDISKIIKQLKLEKDVKEFRSVYGEESRLATEEEMQNPRELFKQHICKVLIKKKDGTFSSIIGTNNKDTLSKCYGKGYFGLYESFGVRAWFVESYIENHSDDIKDVEFALNEAGFDIDAQFFLGLVGKEDVKENKYYTTLFDCYCEKIRKSASGDSIMIRTLSGRYSKKSNKAVDYYSSVDMGKVQRILVMD